MEQQHRDFEDYGDDDDENIVDTSGPQCPLRLDDNNNGQDDVRLET